jgi:hypothetical protein
MPTWLRIVLAIVVAAHGIGHILFLLPLLGAANWGQSAQSWLLGDGLFAKVIGGLIWLLAIVGFLTVAFGIFQETDWWRTLALAAAVVSTLGLALFWARPAGSPVISALVFNLLVAGALLVLNWPAAAQAGG